VGLQLAVSQNRVVAPRKVIRHYDPSKDGSITIARRIKEVFESYRNKFKEKKEKNNRYHPSVSGTKRKTLKHFFVGTSLVCKYSLLPWGFGT